MVDHSTGAPGDPSRRPRSRAAPAGAWPASSLLGSLPSDARDAFVRLGIRREHQDNERLMREGEYGDHVFLLLQGWFKVVAATDDGREALMSIRAGGDLVGELATLDGEPRSATVKAVGQGISRQINRATFMTFLSAHDVAWEAVMRSVAAKLRWATRRRQEFASCSVNVRVARILAELVRAYGQPEPDGVSISAVFTQPDLAALVGAAEPSVHRTLAALRKKGIVETGYRRILIRDVAALAALAGMGSDPALPLSAPPPQRRRAMQPPPPLTPLPRQ